MVRQTLWKRLSLGQGWRDGGPWTEALTLLVKAGPMMWLVDGEANPWTVMNGGLPI